MTEAVSFPGGFSYSQLGPTDQANQELLKQQADYAQQQAQGKYIENQFKAPWVPQMAALAQGMPQMLQAVQAEEATNNAAPKTALPGLLSNAATPQQPLQVQVQPGQKPPGQPQAMPQGVSAPQQPIPQPYPQTPQQQQGNTAPKGVMPPMAQAPIGASAAPPPMQVQGTVQQDAPEDVPPVETTKDRAISDARKAAFSSQAAENFQPVPTTMGPARAQLYQSLKFAASVGAIGPEAAEGVRTSFEQSQAHENQRRLNQANKSYSSSESIIKAAEDGIASNKPDAGYQAIKTIDPVTAASIPPNISNKEIKDMFSQYGGSVYRYTGRSPVLRDDGYVVDSQTGDPILGHNYRVGLSVAQRAEFARGLETNLVSVYGNNNQEQKVNGVTLWNLNHPNDKVKDGNELADRYILDSASTGKTPSQLYSKDIETAGGSVPSPVPVPGASVTPGDTVKGPKSPPPTQIKPNTAGIPRAIQETAGDLYSPNAPTGKLDLSKWPLKPSFVTGGQFSGQSPEDNAAMVRYNTQANDTTTRMKDIATGANTSILRDTLSLRQLENAETGPLSDYINNAKKVVTEILKTNSTLLDEVRQGSPVSGDILGKFLTQGAATNFAANNTLGGARATGPVFEFAKASSANLAQTKEAINYLLRLDAAHAYYDRNMATTDFNKLKNHVDISNYEDTYKANNKLEDRLPIYLLAMDKYGNIDNKSKGSPINPYAYEEGITYPPGSYALFPDGKLRKASK